LRRRAEAADAEARTLFTAPPFRLPTGGRERGKAGKLNAAEVGVAHHAFLQFARLERTASELDLRNEAARLEAAGAMSAGQVAALNFAALTRFWQSELGRAIARSAAAVHRELPFTARFRAAELRAAQLPTATSPLADEEFLVVQGVADLAVILPAEIWLVDFKTDALAAEALEQKTREYRPQLELYARALEKIYGRPVTQCALHFLATGDTVRVRAA
jgi:ATP-dependent helicase/nuclease subunit A